MITRDFATQIRSLDEKRRQITFTASTESVDRYSDLIRVSGWKLENYKKNPVVLWSHRSSNPPIGKCVGIWTEENPPALVQTVQFADATAYPFADTIFKLCRGGFINGCSVGFLPLEEPGFVYDADGNPTGGREYRKQELLELSITPVPANAEALARAIGKTKSADAEHLNAALRQLFGPADDEIAKIFDELRDQTSIIAPALRNALNR